MCSAHSNKTNNKNEDHKTPADEDADTDSIKFEKEANERCIEEFETSEDIPCVVRIK